MENLIMVIGEAKISDGIVKFVATATEIGVEVAKTFIDDNNEEELLLNYEKFENWEEAEKYAESQPFEFTWEIYERI